MATPSVRAIRGAALDALNTLCKIRHDFATKAGVEPALVFRADIAADVPPAVMGAALAVGADFTRTVRPVVAMFVDSPAGSMVMPALVRVERAISNLASAAAGLPGWNFGRELDHAFGAINGLLPLLNMEAPGRAVAEPATPLAPLEEVVLRTLAKRRLRVAELMATIDDDNVARHGVPINGSRDSIADCLRALEGRGLVHRPAGPRKGWVATTAGAALVP